MSEALPPPIWVDSEKSLRAMVDDLRVQERMAVDTESNSLHAFREQVCLVQFSSRGADYLVDPFALPDLEGLSQIFSESKIEKIFHAAEYDLICLRRDFGYSFVNLFDTMQAARILGYPAVGLDRLLGEKFGIKIDKRHQKANWGARPLSNEQIHYARLDTHYLFDLREALEAELIASDRLQIAREDFSRLCAVDDLKGKINGETWQKFSGRKDLSLRELTVLSRLCRWRDLEAEKLDRPPYKVVMEDVLILLSKRPVEKLVDLSAAGMSEKQIKRWGSAVLGVIHEGLQAPLVRRKREDSKSDAVLKRLDQLKSWRKSLGLQMKVDSDVILPKPYLTMLSENPPRSLDELAVLMKDTPTRAQRFGAQILHVLGGQSAH
ncbi:MAG: ribonuclease D [Chloroflexi bacterium]|nr:ribonuclease D [Chloroflexota bacterium]